jgi:hypothetical protein
MQPRVEARPVNGLVIPDAHRYDDVLCLVGDEDTNVGHRHLDARHSA